MDKIYKNIPYGVISRILENKPSSFSMKFSVMNILFIANET